MTPGEEVEVLKAAVARLSEHFETVRIFVTRQHRKEEDDEQPTGHITWGCGNWFAQFGQIRCWLLKEEEGERMRVREEHEP